MLSWVVYFLTFLAHFVLPGLLFSLWPSFSPHRPSGPSRPSMPSWTSLIFVGLRLPPAFSLNTNPIHADLSSDPCGLLGSMTQFEPSFPPLVVYVINDQSWPWDSQIWPSHSSLWSATWSFLALFEPPGPFGLACPLTLYMALYDHPGYLGLSHLSSITHKLAHYSVLSRLTGPH
jgi:hypothetical protein